MSNMVKYFTAKAFSIIGYSFVYISFENCSIKSTFIGGGGGGVVVDVVGQFWCCDADAIYEREDDHWNADDGDGQVGLEPRPAARGATRLSRLRVLVDGGRVLTWNDQVLH